MLQQFPLTCRTIDKYQPRDKELVYKLKSSNYHTFLGLVREQTVQKEEGERVCGGTRSIPPILCRIHLRKVAQYRLQILKKLRGTLHLERQARSSSQFSITKKNQTKRVTTVSLRQQLLETKIPSTAAASRSLLRSNPPPFPLCSTAASTSEPVE